MTTVNLPILAIERKECFNTSTLSWGARFIYTAPVPGAYRTSRVVTQTLIECHSPL